jgi:hypothetical protein
MTEYEFQVRVTSSGSAGVALYIPAEIVKISDLKKMINQKVDCVLDEDGDIIVGLSVFDDE